ncbi:kinase modulator [Lithospermum erythrorhizon]|uniref:Kinase modulator n=1 Tax=Lithospermum erythrorhizon TaxID=34254 RepID=A0AAV3QC76_LITER
MNAHLNAADEYSDEEYIDMEVGSQETIFCHFESNPIHPSREFEFQMFSSSSEKDTTTSPADELFYKGKLLPLHLPPRLQMVEKLLQNYGTYSFEESFSTPLFTPSANTPIANTPFESSEKADNQTGEDDQNSKKSWTRRMKLVKQSALHSKLKASRAYLKSFFTKSGCSYMASATALTNVNEPKVLQAEICKEKHAIVAIKAPIGQIQKGRHLITSSVISRSFKKEASADNEKGQHRRSFSVAFKRISSSQYTSSESSSSSSSASSSNNSKGFQDMHFFKKSISTNLEVENPIQAAIAHCKKSQQQFHSRKTLSDIGLCSLSASRIIH